MAIHPQTKGALALCAFAVTAWSCGSEPSESSSTETGTVILDTAESLNEYLFTNGDFESDGVGAVPSGWTTLNYTNATGVSGTSTAPPTTFSSLNLGTAGTAKDETFVVGGTLLSQSDPDLGSAQSFRYPIYGTRSGRVNYLSSTDNGKNKNANLIRQRQTTSITDIDDLDGLVHVRFAIAPVLENPSHSYNQQPYYYVELLNITRGTALYTAFNTAGESGVPWHTTKSIVTGNQTLWLDWQLVDIAPGASALAAGDTVQLTVVASGCALGGHFGRVYVDGVGSTVPGPYVYATAPQTVNAGSTLQYTLRYRNGGTGNAIGAHADMTMPPNTTFNAVSLSGCSAPTAGTAGTLSCPLGTLAPGASGSFTVTVNVSSSATGSIVNGTYSIGATNAATLLGAKVKTTVNSTSTSNIDLEVKQTAAASNLDPATNTNTYYCPSGSRPACTGITPLYTITVKNLSKTTAVKGNAPTVSDVLPSQLTNTYWSCTASGGTSSGNPASKCRDSSGNGNSSVTGTGTVSISPRLGYDNGTSGPGMITVQVWGQLKSGASGTMVNQASSTAASGVNDPDMTNNTALTNVLIGTANTLSVSKSGTGTGTVTSSAIGLSCGSTCSASVANNTQVVLNAALTNGSTFTSWSGCTATPGVPTQCTVTVNGATNVTATFAAAPTVGSAAAVYVYGGNNQTARTSTQYATQLAVFVTDSNGLPVPNATVNFAAPASGASVTFSNSGSVTTGTTGAAYITATANGTVGSVAITASVPGVSTPAQFSLVNAGAPASIVYLGGGNVTDPQSASLNTAFGAPLMATVYDSQNNPVPGATVTFTVPSSGASATLSSSSAVTDSSGTVSVTATANGTASAISGGKPVPYNVTATTSGASTPATFYLGNYTASPASVYVVSGNPQTTALSSAFGLPLKVAVADIGGNPVPSTSVTFTAGTVASATATLSNGTTSASSVSSTTDVTGLTSVTATSNATGGSYTVQASVSGVSSPAVFNLTNDGGLALSITGGTPQTAAISSAFGTALTVQVLDVNGTPPNPGVVVTFAAPSSGATATLSSTTATTDTTTGLASVTATANSQSGNYTIVASTPSSPATGSFSLTNNCTADSQCPSSAPICDSSSGSCVTCSTNSQCNSKSASAPYCTTAGTCAACTTDSQCTSSTSPICSQATNACAACSSNTQCSILSPSQPVCDVSGACFACVSDSDCGAATPSCNTTTHTCGVAACSPSLSAPTNGSVSATSGVTGDVVSYSCNSGYALTGSATTTCQSDRTWSNVAPTCVAQACASSLSAPTNGSVNTTSGVTGTVATYSCSSGYALSGSSTTTCQADHTWSNAAPTCVAQACTTTLSAPTNGSVDGTSGTTGTVRTYSCSSGYTLTGSSTTTCQADHTWSNAAPTCVAQACTTSLSAPTNGSVDGTSGTTGTVRTYSCSSGYTLTGSSTTTCQASHTWSNAAPTCVAQACTTSLSAPTNGSVDTTSGVTGTTATYSCSSGYSLTGSTTTTCQADHTWSNVAPTCVAQACTTSLSAPTNGGVDGTSGTTGTVRTYSCNSGYTLTGSATTTCQASHTWSNAAPTCVAQACTASLSAPTNGSVDGTSGTTGIVRTYSCSSGYTLTGSATTTCQADHSWSNPAPTCAAQACTASLSAPTNGSVDTTSGTTGTVATYSCSSGYTLTGSATTTCQASHTWSNVAPTCVAQACTASLSAPTNGSVDGTSGTTGTVRTYSCSSGYTLTGSSTTTCQADHTWNNAAPTCVAQACTASLSAPTNGSVDGTSGVTGTVRTYSCGSGYALTGSATTTCQADHSWSNLAPTCAAQACTASLSAPANGSVDGTTGVTGTVRTYGCSAGFTLTGATTTTCQGDHTWSNAAPTCVAQACTASLSAPANGSVDGTSGVTGTVRTYSCGSGYSVLGSTTTTCQADHTWSNAAPTCSADACAPALVPPVHGSVDATSGITGDVRTYSCNAGYTASGTTTTTCQANHTWSNPAPTCTANNCTSSLSAPVNGSVDGTSGATGDSHTYSCDSGYTVNGTARTTCQANGTWSSAAPTCVADACTSTLSAPANGSVDGTSGVTGTMRTYACNPAYELNGSATATCRADHTWSSAPPTCNHIDGACTDDTMCDTATEWCDIAAMVCRTKVANGGAMPIDPGHHEPSLTGTCNADAATLVCKSGVCDPIDDRCGIDDDHGPCTPDDGDVVCRAGFCSVDLACGLPNGEGYCDATTGPVACRSGNCSTHGNVCVPEGGCAVDADCTDQWCNTETFTCTPKIGNGDGLPTVTGHLPDLDGSCSPAIADAVCVSGVCDEDDNCGLLDGSAGCNQDNGTVVCRSGRCSEHSGVCIPNSGCAVDADCQTDEWCRPTTSLCAAKLVNGTAVPDVEGHNPVLDGTCSADVATAVCVSGVCDSDNACGFANGDGECTLDNAGVVCRSHTCSPTAGVCIPAGGCVVDADCNQGDWCNTDTMTCEAQLLNDASMPIVGSHSPELDGHCSPAAAAVVCVSGVCDDSDDRCGLAAGSGTCDADSAETVCRSKQCSNNGLCLALGTCLVDNDCDTMTQYCDTSQSLCAPKLDNGFAIPTVRGHAPVLDGTCSDAVAAIVCISGVCDAADNACGHANGYGSCDATNAFEVCRSGVCATTGDAAGTCVECTTDDQCGGAQAACDPVTLRCVQCTATSAMDCTGSTPVCDPTNDTCAACNGDFGSEATRACDSSDTPYCWKTGALQGECGQCAIDADCTGHPGGSRCDTATGACVTGCADDTQCASAEYCDATQICAGKHADGETCSADNQCVSAACTDGACGVPQTPPPTDPTPSDPTPSDPTPDAPVTPTPDAPATQDFVPGGSGVGLNCNASGAEGGLVMVLAIAAVMLRAGRRRAAHR